VDDFPLVTQGPPRGPEGNAAGSGRLATISEKKWLADSSLWTISDGRAAGGVEEAVQFQWLRARVLEAVGLAARKVEAAAGADRRRGVSGPEAPLAFEDAYDFFVLVEMIGRTARRNEADELRDLLTAGLRVHQNAKPATVARVFRRLILESDDRGAGGSRGRRRFAFLEENPGPGIRAARADEQERRLSRVGQREPRARAREDARVRLDSMVLALGANVPDSGKDKEDLVAIGISPGGAAARGRLEHGE
jgi:hypothetical protein